MSRTTTLLLEEVLGLDGIAPMVLESLRQTSKRPTAHHLVDFDALQLTHHLQPRHQLVGRRGGEHQHLGNLPQRPQRRHKQVVADADDGPDEGRQRSLGALLACDGGGGSRGCGVSR